ncbi:hypothetical protein Q8A67_003269 [Cirrhinus molitorella]|uniref:Uncharacterized protein n=1 Tax=Cirrhinus molitorella TaxID=172907 RepID=A0AA88QEY0_9TELE|nr:hypothetical protein Q8A67_003269 [Cirrhinus molitorella]
MFALFAIHTSVNCNPSLPASDAQQQEGLKTPLKQNSNRLIHTCPGEHASPRKQHRPNTRSPADPTNAEVYSHIYRSLSDLDSSLRVFDRLWLTLDLRGCQFVKYPKRGGTSLQSSSDTSFDTSD